MWRDGPASFVVLRERGAVGDRYHGGAGKPFAQRRVQALLGFLVETRRDPIEEDPDHFNLVNCTFHPINIQSTSGIGGTRYPNVGNNGGTSGTVTLTAPITEVANTLSLFYQCGNHAPLNGVINVVDPTVDSHPTPTPTPTPLPCVGDCNGDNLVTVDELLTMVNIALGNASVSICSQADATGDSQITVDENLAAVNNVLSGCAAV